MSDRDRLAAARVARLATLRRDGTPRLVPCTFALVDELVVIGIDDVKPKSGRPLARLADIARDPRVALLADRYDEDWSQLWWVRMDGTAVLHEAYPAAEEALRAKYAQYAQAQFAAVVAITPTAWAGWSAAGPGG